MRGTTVEVAAIGSFPDWPVAAWCSRGDIAVAAAEESGKIVVTIPAEASPGVCWIRLHTAGGAATPRPFVVGHLPEVLEQDPNDSPAEPQTISSLPMTINGRFSGRNDADVYSFTAAAGQTIVSSLDAQHSLGSPVDAALQIVSADGFVLAQSHDVRGTDPLAVHVATVGGTYLVRAFGFPQTADSTIGFSAGDDFVYRLTLACGPYLDYVSPFAVMQGESVSAEVFGWNVPDELRQLSIAATGEEERLVLFSPALAGTAGVRIERHACFRAEGGTLDAPQPLALPCSVSGRLAQPRERDAYSFQAVEGQAFEFTIESRALGMQLDGVLQVLDAAGTVLARADDVGENRDPELLFNAPRAETYRLVVSDLFRRGGGRQAYLLRATAAEPDFRLTVAEHAFQPAAGAPLEIAIAIERRHGFAGDIALEARNLPAGVTAAACVSSAGETAQQVKLILSGAAAAGAPFRIVGRETGEAPRERAARWAAAPASLPLWDFWLAPAPQ